MTTNDVPPLEPFKEHLYVVLMEECAEVIKAASKIIRFWESEENRDHLSFEINDLIAVLEMINEESTTPFIIEDQTKIEAKKEKVIHYFNLMSNEKENHES